MFDFVKGGSMHIEDAKRENPLLRPELRKAGNVASMLTKNVNI